MGQRICFFKNNFNEGLNEIIVEHYTSFRRWYLDEAQSSNNAFDEQFGDEHLTDYFNQNRELKTDFENLDHRLVDELTATFISYYCDSINSDLFELFGPTMNVWRYEESHKLVLATKDQDFITHWNFLVKGRSLKDNLPFDSYSNDCKIGYLSVDEYKWLQEKITSHFGSLEHIRELYWTEKEKHDFEQVMLNTTTGSYALSDHNPKSSGLEYVLTALHELTNSNNEIITRIE